MTDLFNYHRRLSSETKVGDTPMGGDNPIRLQSMATVSTNDIMGSVEQAERIIEAGGEYVRFTTQGTREAENIGHIRSSLREKGITTPLVADVHFNARVAEVAACNCEKVRINPGNYVDPARTFRQIEYTDEQYALELKKVEERLIPLLNLCKEHHTAIRIGVNHGSLSDRIMSRYGDTPEGIVESCMEFLRICKREDFNDIVISIKASNTVVMVRSVRLLVSEMDKEDMHYPLHLGVTEAGEGEDGRIKSAVGIGALLADGIGDTIRVSLSEAPEHEIPVARHLVDYISQRKEGTCIEASPFEGFNYTRPERRKTNKVFDVVGGDSLPIVIVSGNADGIVPGELQPTFVYTAGKKLLHTEGKQPCIMDAGSTNNMSGTFSLYSQDDLKGICQSDDAIKFWSLHHGLDSERIECLKAHPEIVVVSDATGANRLGEHRALVHELMAAGVTNPVVFRQKYAHGMTEKNDFQIEAAADMGPLMMDGLTDGYWLENDGDIPLDVICSTAYGILQAARLRMTKTEYISCPGCGRTLYDLETTIARIKKATSHLKGLKIGIMGCIVNGPGEMADADYGYVGAGPGRISLYRRKECVEKNIPESEAVEKLLQLIEKDNKS